MLRYGTLGYLPPNVLEQLFAPVPGTGGGPTTPGGTGIVSGGGGGSVVMPPPPTSGGGIGGGGTGGGDLLPVLRSLGIGSDLQIGTGLPGIPGFGGDEGPIIPTGSVPFDIGQFIQGRLSVPQYQGPFTAPLNPLQSTAASGAGSALEAFFGYPSSRTGPPPGPVIQPPIPGPFRLSGTNAPLNLPGAGAGAGGAGLDIGNLILASLLGRGTQTGGTPERSLLTMLGATGPQANLTSAFQALDEARRAGLGRDIRDLREQFSFSGNRFGSDLANAIAARQAESEASFLGQAAPLAAQLAPQLFGQQVSALGTAGQLGLGTGEQSLQALLGLPSAFSTTSLLPGQVAGQGFNLGEQLRQIMQGDVAGRQAEFTRTQGALFPTLLQYAAGAPQIFTPGIGQQLLGAGTTLGAASLGAK